MARLVLTLNAGSSSLKYALFAWGEDAKLTALFDYKLQLADMWATEHESRAEIIDRYKLRDPQYKKGSRAYGVPQPIIFVLNRNGVVRAKLYEDTFQKRPPVVLVIETLDKLAGGGAP